VLVRVNSANVVLKYYYVML